MDQVSCGDSPLKKNISIPEKPFCIKNPPIFTTPVKKNDGKKWQNSYASSLTGLTILPTHITPPSGLTKFIARNPFDADLTSRLHLSVISPTVFNKVSLTPQRDSPGFVWSVDELALIQPAKIEEFPLQHTHSPDPDLEIVAQAAIDKFFTENEIIPSPWDSRRKEKDVKLEMQTPNRPQDNLSMIRESQRVKKDSSAQTVLSLPPTLPKEVEEALKPYFTFNQDQNVESDDANSSNNSLRRKLFFNNDDYIDDDDDDDSSFSLSPTRSHGSMIPASSPPQSGMLVHGTPLRVSSFRLRRTHGTPCPGIVSPPNMSPICNSNMSCQSVRSRSQFTTRLDFETDMSIDISLRDDKELKRIEDFEDDMNTSLLRSNVRGEEPKIHSENCDGFFNGDRAQDHNETKEMLSHETTPLKLEINEKFKATSIKSNEILDYIKNPIDWCKQMNKNDTYLNENNTLLGNSCSGQQSDGNSAQDTGYQTYSMSNMTGTTENLSIAPITKSFNWNDRILSNPVDEIRLSDWQDNMKNMFSSTPSKYSRRNDS